MRKLILWFVFFLAKTAVFFAMRRHTQKKNKADQSFMKNAKASQMNTYARYQIHPLDESKPKKQGPLLEGDEL